MLPRDPATWRRPGSQRVSCLCTTRTSCSEVGRGLRGHCPDLRPTDRFPDLPVPSPSLGQPHPRCSPLSFSHDYSPKVLTQTKHRAALLSELLLQAQLGPSDPHLISREQTLDPPGPLRPQRKSRLPGTPALISSQETIQMGPVTPHILSSIFILTPTHSWRTSQETATFSKLTWTPRPSPRHCPWRKDARASSRRGRVLGLFPIPAPGLGRARSSGVGLMVRPLTLRLPFPCVGKMECIQADENEGLQPVLSFCQAWLFFLLSQLFKAYLGY